MDNKTKAAIISAIAVIGAALITGLPQYLDTPIPTPTPTPTPTPKPKPTPTPTPTPTPVAKVTVPPPEATPTPTPLISVSPDPISFNLGSMKAGETTSRSFSIGNTGGGTLTWSVSNDMPGITMNPTSGTNSGTVTITINTDGLSPGTYTGTIIISSNAGTKIGNVQFILEQGPLLSISPDPLYLDFGTLSLRKGDVVSRTFSITNTGGGTLEWFVAVDYSYMGLTITPKYNSELGYSGINSGVVTVTIDANGLKELGFSPRESLEEELFINYTFAEIIIR